MQCRISYTVLAPFYGIGRKHTGVLFCLNTTVLAFNGLRGTSMRFVDYICPLKLG